VTRNNNQAASLLGTGVLAHVKGAKKPIRTADKHGDIGAERAENAGEFDSNVASTHNHNVSWLRFQLEEAVGCDHVFLARDVRQAWFTTHGNQHVIGLRKHLQNP
jgi:hypothetical protein